MINSLLMTSLKLPCFSQILVEHVVPAITKILNDCQKTVEKVVAHGTPYTWDNLCLPLDEVNDALERIFSQVKHLHSVKNNSLLREAYELILPLVTQYRSWFGQHEGLYNAYCDLRNGRYYAWLSTPQKKAVDNTLLAFKLSGVCLSRTNLVRYGQIASLLSKLSNKYSNNVLDSTMGWTRLVTNKDELSGIPESSLAAAKECAKLKDQEGWLLTLDLPSYIPVITYCDNQILRKEMYYAYNTRASDKGPNAGKWDNSPVMALILSLRHEQAQLLGFKNYASKSLVTKMAKNTQQVIDFLTDLTKLTRNKGKKELAQLYAFVQTNFGVNKLQPWDIAYYSAKHKLHLYGIRDELLRAFFPEKKVVDGLFEVVNRVYGITVKERMDIDVWHSDVRFFELYDENNELRGSFYLDLYTRENKCSGAWMDECVSQMRKSNGQLQKPIAHLICNFNRPVKGNPALLTHNEVITLFHEFGHGMHHMLTRIETAGVSGINGVPWDVVELPSQLMEKWCWESKVLMLISGHFETGNPLPNDLINKMIAAKNHQAAISILRQLELSLFDFCLHVEFNPKKRVNILKTLVDIKKLVTVIPWVTWDRFPHTFSHIFAGSYASGYYSYLWANVLATDVYSSFEEAGVLNREVGLSFMEKILICGGSVDLMEMFKRFRGRKPLLDAILKYYGLKD